MKKLLKIFVNHPNAFVIVSGGLFLWLGRKCTRIVEEKLLNMKILETSASLQKLLPLPLYIGKNAGYREIFNYVSEICYNIKMRKKIQWQTQSGKKKTLDEEGEKKYLELGKTLEKLTFQAFYIGIDNKKNSYSFDQMKQIKLVKDDIFAELKMWFFGFSKDVLVKEHIFLNLKGCVEEIEGSELNSSDVLSEDGKEFSCEKIIRKAEKMIEDLQTKDITEPTKSGLYANLYLLSACAKYIDKKSEIDRTETPLGIKAARSLVPVAALGVGLATRYLCMNRGGAFR